MEWRVGSQNGTVERWPKSGRRTSARFMMSIPPKKKKKKRAKLR